MLLWLHVTVRCNETWIWIKRTLSHTRICEILPAFIRRYIFSHVKKIWIWNWKSVPTEACVYTRQPRPKTHLCVQSGREMFFFFKLPLLLFSHDNDDKKKAESDRYREKTLRYIKWCGEAPPSNGVLNLTYSFKHNSRLHSSTVCLPDIRNAHRSHVSAGFFFFCECYAGYFWMITYGVKFPRASCQVSWVLSGGGNMKVWWCYTSESEKTTKNNECEK